MTSRSLPRTSVIIPARNAGRTLARTLDCLRAQSDADWEALVIDDGSLDETADILGRYTQQDRRFIGLEGAGAGVSAARNVGLARARGRRLLFLDSDDWIDDRFLELMNGAIETAPDAVAAYCGDRRVMPDGRETPVRSDPHIADAPFETFRRSCALAIHAVLIDRETVAGIGGFDPSLKTCEDWDFWQRVTARRGRWVHVDAPLSYYRVSEGSLTSDVRQLLSDAATVIQRGFWRAEIPGSPDAEGRPADIAYACFALWCGALDCGSGGTGAAAVERLRTVPCPLDTVHSIPAVLLDGVTVGLRAVPSQLAARWPEYGARVTALIDELGNVWNDSVAARRLEYGWERLILDYDDLAAPRCMARTLGVRVDLRDPAPITPPPGVDRLYVYLCDGEVVHALVDIGALGTITKRHWLELANSCLGVERVVSCAGSSSPRSRVARVVERALGRVGDASRGVRRRLGRGDPGAGSAPIALLQAAGPGWPPGSHGAQLDRIRHEAEDSIARAPRPPDPTQNAAPRRTKKGRKGGRRAFWEDQFRAPDPWNYGSPYEQEKYGRQLDMLPDSPLGTAVELACAEGRFTEMIAPRVERLIAVDISAAALERARHRCRSKNNVEFQRLDLAADALPEDVDVIVCSEVLYYLDGQSELERVAQRLTATLKPGGHIVTAHAFVLKDDLSRTGFDWEAPWGASTINRVFAEVPGLALERSLCTELYRIDRFVRLEEGHPAVHPTVESLPVTANIEPDVARHIVRGGAAARRAELAVTERHPQVPVLLYHRVAEDGPASLARYRVSGETFHAQMAWLRRNGYHSIVSEELAWFLENDHPFVGRPVMISFDDGFQDFAEHAWPALRAHDFRAQVFVSTDHVGGAAEWDRRRGEPASLMDARTIEQLALEGVVFGSHLATHRAADGLSTEALARELARSRTQLMQWTGRPVDSFAAPFGRSDERVRRLAAECGFRTGFSTEPGVACLGDDPFDLCRIDVPGDWSIEAFTSHMRGCAR